MSNINQHGVDTSKINVGDQVSFRQVNTIRNVGQPDDRIVVVARTRFPECIDYLVDGRYSSVRMDNIMYRYPRQPKEGE